MHIAGAAGRLSVAAIEVNGVEPSPIGAARPHWSLSGGSAHSEMASSANAPSQLSSQQAGSAAQVASQHSGSLHPGPLCASKHGPAAEEQGFAQRISQVNART